MISELDIVLSGVSFPRDANGKLRPEGPPGADLRTAVAERREAVRRFLFENERSGVDIGMCDACSLPMGLACHCSFCEKSTPAERWKKHGSRSNRGGLCWLCECAVQKMMAAGEWPPKSTWIAYERDIEAMIARLPPKPKAPWEMPDA